MLDSKECVSIPFKRESVSELGWCHSQFQKGICFNSLQTGKRIWTYRLRWGVRSNRVSIPFKRESVSEPGSFCWMARHHWFQFPSNGKAYLNFELRKRRRTLKLVSIPFKRESVSEPGLTTLTVLMRHLSFNSLQTGKRIWTLIRRFGSILIHLYVFQFPSNGKAYLNHNIRTCGYDELS